MTVHQCICYMQDDTIAIYVFFFFKQKTAYEIYQCDWSSDVCSSDLIIKIIEESASSQVYSLLKRPDEKFVTEEAYDNPRFVEDLVRDVYLKMDAREEVDWFSIEAENFESIHNHSAYAFVEKKV